MDIDYMDQFRVFTYDKERFLDSKKLQEYVNGKNMKTVYMIDRAYQGFHAYWNRWSME